MALTGRDLISMLDFGRAELEAIFDKADTMQRFTRTCKSYLKDKLMSTLFFEPSTRTRLSFEAAMHRLGGSVVGFADPKVSSVAKGETLGDTIRTVESYSDVIVVRHRIEGAAKLAAEIAQVPVINAGDGSQHHPSQTLTDLYTIRNQFGKIDGRKIMFMGDLRHTRSASSFAYGISYYNNVTLFLVSPISLMMRPEITDHLKRKRVRYEETENPLDFVEEADVIYVTRLQEERLEDPSQAEMLRGSYALNQDLLKHARDDAIVMHHLPRIEEIPIEIDYTPHARYFEQAANGLLVRMAFLYLSLRKFKYEPTRRREAPKAEAQLLRCSNTNCISNQPREPVVPKLSEVRRDSVTLLQCEYCGRYSNK